MPLFITYEISTEESIENGDAAERGYCQPGGWHFDEYCTVTLRQAVDNLGHLSSDWDGEVYTETSGKIDYRTGFHEMKTLHVKATQASRERVQRVLRAHRLLG